MKMEQIECSETSAYKIRTPENYPEENIQHTKNGESLKSRIPSGSMKGGRGLLHHLSPLASQVLLHRASPLDMNMKNNVPKCQQ
jgi:hypothetical protein